MQRIAILGGGRMGEALIAGLLDSGFEADGLSVAEADADRRRALETVFPGVRVVPAAAWALPEADVAVVAVKPGDVALVLGGALEAVGMATLVVSIAAGITIGALETLVPGRPVIRAMPNTPALVRKGAAAISAGTHATEQHMGIAERVLGAVGTVVRVPENQLDAVTGLSGSGPAYVFLIAEAMIEAGVLAGLARETSAALVRQTLLGSATLLAGGTSATELREAVTSPGGTTAAGLRELEVRGVRAAMLDAVAAATARSRELGA